MVRTITFAGDWPLTQDFNDPCCRASYFGFGLNGHNGLDFGLPQGVELYAPEDGTIAEAYHDDGGYGLTTYLNATGGRGWRHGHLWRLDVAAGELVRKGQRLGLSGNTGNSTGPHLHLGMRPPNPHYGNGFNGYIDPLPTLEWMMENQMTPEQQQLIDAAAHWQIPDAGTLNFMMGTRQTLAEQVASLEQLKAAAQNERDQYMAEVERLKTQGGGVAVEVASVAVRLTDGREVVR